MTVLWNLELENIDRCFNYVNNCVFFNVIHKEQQTSHRLALINEYFYRYNNTCSHMHTQF